MTRSDNSLENQILTILAKEGSLKAREIVDKLYLLYKVNHDKTEVNRCLYYKLNFKVIQDNQYRWRLRIKAEQNFVTETQKIQIPNTPLAKLTSYYLDCIAKDMDDGISVFSSNRYGSPDYGQLKAIPSIDNNTDIYNTEIVRNIISKFKKGNSKYILRLGYLLNIRKFVKQEATYYFIEPLILLPYDTDIIWGSNRIQLSDEIPQLNNKAIRSLTGKDNRELLEEIIQLSEELGLNNKPEEQPNLDDIANRLYALHPDWRWRENVDPQNLSSLDMMQQTEEGIYNTAAIFISERSRYTQGLEKELSELRLLEESNYINSSLGQWISKRLPEENDHDYDLLEPLPLNDEQRKAVRQALRSPLTVITGPPGTGKSQVVTSILLNAVYNGQKILFASKNNKAVDVVTDRLNGLSSRPIMLRLGKNELQAELVKYLTNLLSSTTTESDHENFKVSKEKFTKIVSILKTFTQQQKELVELRNKVDNLEQKMEPYRNEFTEDKFFAFKEITSEEINEHQKIIDELKRTIVNADRNKQSFFTKIFWKYLRDKRIAEVNNLLKISNKIISSLNIPAFDELNENTDLTQHFSTIEKVYEMINKANEIRSYFLLLKELQEKKSLFDISKDIKINENELQDISMDVWENWLRILPEKLSQSDRQTLTEYVTLLGLIVRANETRSTLERKTFARYYATLPKVANILSCWAVTSLSARGKVPFSSGFFDLIVIDEASQCDIASALPLLYRTKKIIIIGDNKQLTHVTPLNENQDIQLLDKYNLQEGFFSWSYVQNSLFMLALSICKAEDIIELKDHHRSHADIITYSNKEFYNEKLRIATKYENLKSIPNEPALRWIHISGEVTTPSGGSSVNKKEAEEVIKELKRLVTAKYPGSIGVVTPFRAQFQYIDELVKKDKHLFESLIHNNFLADTAHGFQGDERDIIIFSPVISKNIGKGSLYFLQRTGNLFNVAITRARAALIIVGDLSYCTSSEIPYMKRFVEYYKKVNEAFYSDTPGSFEDYGSEYPTVPVNAIISEWEKILYKELYKKNIKTHPQYKVSQYMLDLALIKDKKKLDIEVDGERYHRNWDGELCKRDQIRNIRLLELGWDVKRFWVYEIRDDLQRCIQEVKDWIR